MGKQESRRKRVTQITKETLMLLGILIIFYVAQGMAVALG